MVESERHSGNVVQTEIRLYITSLPCDVKRFAQAVRRHWGIKNSVHWVLDVAFREDDCRIRMGRAAENFSILRRLVLNLIKRESTMKRG